MGPLMRTRFGELGRVSVLLREVLGFVTGRQTPLSWRKARPVLHRKQTAVPVCGRASIDRATGEVTLSGLNMSEAVEALDWLEATGQRVREASIDREHFTVRWRPDVASGVADDSVTRARTFFDAFLKQRAEASRK